MKKATLTKADTAAAAGRKGMKSGGCTDIICAIKKTTSGEVQGGSAEMARARDRAIRITIVVLAVTLLAACQQPGHWWAGGRAFATSGEAQAHFQQMIDHAVEWVEPLPAPLASSLVAVTPTEANAARILRNDYPTLAGERFDYLRQTTYLNWSLPPRQLEKRGIFKTVRVVIADDFRNVDVGPNDYIFWLEAPNRKTLIYHIGPPGSRQLTEILRMIEGPRDPEADVRSFFSAVEGFVSATAR